MKKNEKYSNKIIINNIIKNVLFHQFVILLKIPYIIDNCFIPFLNYLNKKSLKKLMVFFELMWEYVPVSWCSLFCLKDFTFKSIKLLNFIISLISTIFYNTVCFLLNVIRNNSVR